jgi:mRNA-degrading endonuclease YafQ of YafQ-DinJ toxin-antitoxin module
MPTGPFQRDFEENCFLKRILLPTRAFERSARRLVKSNAGLADDLRAVLALLEEDAFHPSLKTHKLKGKLAGSWACSAGYDIRIVFQFVTHKDRNAILLEAVGSHDEVY